MCSDAFVHDLARQMMIAGRTAGTAWIEADGETEAAAPPR
jgi:hypothetical protein